MSSDICLELVDVLQYKREKRIVDSLDAEDKSGVLERNGLVWHARGSFLEVFNRNTVFKVISHNFHTCASKSKPCTIECVEEVDAPEGILLAVGLRLGTEQSQIVFFALRGCREVGRIDVQEDVKLLRYVDPNSCSIGLLSKYQGCLAAGTIDGKVVLIDLCLRQLDNAFGTNIAMNDVSKRQCHIEFSQGELKQLMQHHEKVKSRGLYFGLQLSHNVEASIECILDIVPLKVVSIGFSDGTILLWDMVDHSIMHRIAPPTEDCAVVALNFVEPNDDPKACLYLWAFYAHAEGAFAFLHMIMCEEKYIQQGTYVYDQFLACSSRLNFTSYDPGSVPLNVQTVTKKVSQEEEPITLSVLSWLGSNRKTTVMVFDLNQWYKAEMPYDCDWQQELTHTVVFHLQEESFHARLDERSLVLFRSIQRPEEHFYPSSLSFDIMNFEGTNCTKHRWIGLQNKLLQYLELDGANSIIEPAALYGMLCRAALLPQFFEPISPSDGIVKEQREFVLSLGLEYNCHMFLQSCVEQWADGSNLGENPDRGVSLSTLTDWIWNRSKALKAVCNRMLASQMTDFAGRPVDAWMQDALSHCTRQIKQLGELYRTILKNCLEFIPENVRDRLSKESASIAAAAEYQDILQWLLHIGMLPEAGEADAEVDNDSQKLVRYPFTRLSEYYRTKRRQLEKCNNVPDLDTTGRLLFIDNFLERVFDRETISKAWHDDISASKHALYPPESLQKALRILLIPDTPLEDKLVVLLYLFMDIVATMEDGRYPDIVGQLEKFPRIFKMKLGMVRRVQAFWHLDHGNVSQTVEEFLSPLSNTIDFPQWHRELTVSVLLRLNASNLALKILRAPGCPVSPQLELVTLIRNNLIAEAFSLQRRTPQPDGRQLVWFVEAILEAGKPDTLLEFALTEEEKHVLRLYLAESTFPVSETLKLGHLLQNFEFVDAVQLVDRLGRKRNVEVENEILGLYHNALDPMSQQLASLTYHNPGELEPKATTNVDEDDPKPSKALETLSSALIRNRADFRVRILHRSIAAIKEAAVKTGLQHDRPFLEKPSLGVFQCRPTVRSLNVCYPVRLDPSMNKRRQRECEASLEELANGRIQSSPILNEDDVNGNPRKKRFFGPEVSNSDMNAIKTGKKFANFDMPVPVIPEFRPMKPNFNFTASSFDKATSFGVRSEKSVSHSPSIFLTTPPLARKQPQEHPEPKHLSDSVASDAHTESYTPPGILKPSHSGQCSSPAQIERLGAEAEEKVLRFDLPPGATADDSCMLDEDDEAPVEAISTALTPAIRRDLDLSVISNDDFYSPEVTMEPNSLQQVLAAGPPTGRRSIHRSRSVTPVDQAHHHPDIVGDKIAIIIEDHVEDDESVKPEEDEQQEDVEMELADEGATKENVFVIDDSDAEQATGTEQEPEQEEKHEDHEQEIVILDEECSNQREMADTNGNEFVEKSPTIVDVDHEAIVCDNEQQEDVLEEESSEDDIHSVDVDNLHVDIEDASDEVDVDVYDEIDDEMVDDEDEDEEDDDDDDDDDDSSSVLEVIDLSDEDDDDRAKTETTKPAATILPESSSTSSSSDSDGNDPYDDRPVAEQVANDDDSDDDSATSTERWRYGKYDCESVPVEVFDGDIEVHQQQVVEGSEEQQLVAAPPEDAMGYIQVPTTSSSTHRTETEGQATSEPPREGEAQSSEVEDLSVPQQEAAETPEATGAAARDLSVAGGEQWPDSVASSSSGNPAIAAAGSSNAPPTAAASPSATVARESQTPTQEKAEKVFGQPKNAHELEVPAMNLSVKPDEAHGSSRKNSKGEENGLTEDARALNLSAGQQELGEQGADGDDDNVSSNHEQRDDDTDDIVQEAQSSDEAKTDQRNSEEMEVDLRVSEEEDDVVHSEPPVEEKHEGSEESAPPTVATDNTESSKSTEDTNQRSSTEGTARNIPQRVLNEEASTSTPRTNVKTRLMAAMEKSGTSVELSRTPSRRRTVRATSVAPESSNTPLSPVLSRSRRYTSMDNLVGTPEGTAQPLTPRRSTRAASLVKELFGVSTPSKRMRRTSQASNETDHPADDSVSVNSPPDPLMEPPEPSERSFASSTASSTRRSMRIRKTKPTPQMEPVAEGPSTAEVPLLSDYSSTRRLTRHQLAVLERSMEVVASSSTTRIPAGRSRTSSKDVAAGDSESESVVSNVSNQSSLRSTRSRTNRSATSAARSGRAKSQQSTGPAREDRAQDSDSDQSLAYASSQRGLEPIAEEGESNPVATQKRRGRKPKSEKK